MLSAQEFSELLTRLANRRIDLRLPDDTTPENLAERLWQRTAMKLARPGGDACEPENMQFSTEGGHYPAAHLHTTGERVKRPSPARVKRLVDAQMGRK